MIDWEPVREFWRNNPALDWNELEATVKAANIGGELWGVNTFLHDVDVIGQPDGSIRIQPTARLRAPSAELHWTDKNGEKHFMPVNAAVDELRRLYEASPSGVDGLTARKRIGAVSFDADGGACLHPDYTGCLSELCRTLSAGGPYTAAWAFIETGGINA